MGKRAVWNTIAVLQEPTLTILLLLLILMMLVGVEEETTASQKESTWRTIPTGRNVRVVMGLEVSLFRMIKLTLDALPTLSSSKIPAKFVLLCRRKTINIPCGYSFQPPLLILFLQLKVLVSLCFTVKCCLNWCFSDNFLSHSPQSNVWASWTLCFSFTCSSSWLSFTNLALHPIWHWYWPSCWTLLCPFKCTGMFVLKSHDLHFCFSPVSVSWSEFEFIIGSITIKSICYRKT